MTRDGEIPAIFNPKRVRTPSVVVTGDSPNGPFGGFTNILHASNPQINQSDTASIGGISNQLDGCENVGSYPSNNPQIIGTGSQSNINFSTTITTTNNPENPADSGTPTATADSAPPTTSIHRRRLKACEASCCSELAQKMYFGICVTILVTASWVGATHCIKFLYSNRNAYALSEKNTFDGRYSTLYGSISENNNESSTFPSMSDETIKIRTGITAFNAPFFASWFCTNFAFLFFPIYLLGRIALRKCDKPGEILGDILRGFRDRGFTIGRFLNRCMCFCFLWVFTTYLYALSLNALLATDVLALFATNVGCVYLLSWVILHEQFVGVRIVAVILCDTGIALLAYMDGITGSPTLGGVVLAALAAAGYAVFKVMFRKVMGDPPVGQIAFTFTTLGFLNVATLWPICVGLYLTGNEVMPSDRLPWVVLLIASVLLLVFHILTQFSAAVTYNMFVTLGLITAVPVSAGLDVFLYGAQFAGMKLAGVILIAVGFFLVMFPENWPDYITRLLRKTGRAILHYQCCCDYTEIEYDKSKYHLVGSQREMGSRGPRRLTNGPASYHHRLSDGLYTFPSPFTFRACEMTNQLSQSNYNISKLSPDIDYGNNKRKRHSYVAGIPITSNSNYNINNAGDITGAGGNNNLFLSYFGGNENSTKKKETPFLNFGFRRKSSIFYAATD